MVSEKQVIVRQRTGVPGLDDILMGGFSAGHLFLLEGNPGTGKTTIAMQLAARLGRRRKSPNFSLAFSG